MKKLVIFSSLFLFFSMNSYAQSTIIEQSETLFDCSDVVDEQLEQKILDLKEKTAKNPIFIKFLDKDEVTLTEKEQIELLLIQKSFFQEYQQLNLKFANMSIDCMKTVFPNFPRLN